MEGEEEREMMSKKRRLDDQEEEEEKKKKEDDDIIQIDDDDDDDSKDEGGNGGKEEEKGEEEDSESDIEILQESVEQGIQKIKRDYEIFRGRGTSSIRDPIRVIQGDDEVQVVHSNITTKPTRGHIVIKRIIDRRKIIRPYDSPRESKFTPYSKLFRDGDKKPLAEVTLISSESDSDSDIQFIRPDDLSSDEDKYRPDVSTPSLDFTTTEEEEEKTGKEVPLLTTDQRAEKEGGDVVMDIMEPTEEETAATPSVEAPEVEKMDEGSTPAAAAAAAAEPKKTTPQASPKKKLSTKPKNDLDVENDKDLIYKSIHMLKIVASH